MTLTPKERKQLRTIGQKLKPVVTIASNGLTEGVMLEIDRALNDHELIKIKIVVGDRSVKAEIINLVCENTRAELVQTIGNTALILRHAAQPNPKLSNLIQ